MPSLHTLMVRRWVDVDDRARARLTCPDCDTRIHIQIRPAASIDRLIQVAIAGHHAQYLEPKSTCTCPPGLFAAAADLVRSDCPDHAEARTRPAPPGYEHVHHPEAADV